jgi:phospholipase/lecithinase/hemolysin
MNFLKNALIIFVLFLSEYSIASTNQYNRIIVFGDSLSDMGTYELAAKQLGGGKFTTNPGKLWIEILADEINLPLTINRHEGFGIPTEILGGLNFAQGGARVTLTAPNPNNDKIASAESLFNQIEMYKSEFQDFKYNDLIFIQGGANDIFALFALFRQNKMTAEEAVSKMQTTASEFINLTKQLENLGAKYIFVLNLPIIEKTPFALSLDVNLQNVLADMVNAYNFKLQEAFKNSTIRFINLYQFEESFNNHYQDYGLKNINSMACKFDGLPSKSALFCSSKTLVEPGADQTFKFSDQIHPASRFSNLIGHFIVEEVSK